MRRDENLSRRPKACRNGLTLVEVITALAIGALVVLSARMVLENLAATSVRIVRSAELTDRAANGDRLLRALTGQIEVGTQNATFDGDESSTRFSTWCQSSSGWLERCHVELSVERDSTGPLLVAIINNEERIILRRARSSLVIRYLVDARDGGTWFVKWGDGLLTPGAIGILADSDTTVVRVAEVER